MFVVVQVININDFKKFQNLNHSKQKKLLRISYLKRQHWNWHRRSYSVTKNDTIKKSYFQQRVKELCKCAIVSKNKNIRHSMRPRVRFEDNGHLWLVDWK